MSNIYLIIGICGTGKTWVMKQLMQTLEISPVYTYKTGLYTYVKKDGIMLLGKYDGTVFEGSDRLSMSIMADNAKIKPVFAEARIVVAEGDRFTNSTFIRNFEPHIVKIEGDGAIGRLKRGSSQTERHIKSITTRVTNMPAHVTVKDSQACLDYLLDQINYL